MRLMGIQAIYPRRSGSSPGKGHKRYPYLLRNLPITHVSQVWSADITYVPLLRGFMYLVAVIDWHSRYVLAWQLSNTLDGIFCLDALRQALSTGRPKIFNTDQGAQFTADAFTTCLPGTIASKTVILDHLKAVMNPGAVLFGATLLQGGVSRSRLAQRLMAFYNRKGIFSNRDDDLQGLKHALNRRFRDPSVQVVGCAALFSGRL